MSVTVRKATVGDAAAIAAIYAHHVLHGTASYELVPPSVAETVARIERVTGRGWPFLAACGAAIPSLGRARPGAGTPPPPMTEPSRGSAPGPVRP